MKKEEAKEAVKEAYGNSEYTDEIIKALEQEPKWIPVSELLPNDLEPVNITWVNHNPESYYADIKDKPFTATGVYFDGKWYWWSTLCTDILEEYGHNHNDIIDDNIEIIAWQPLPQSYMAEQEGEEERYRKTLNKFKKKWFNGDREKRLKGYIDEQIGIMRSQLYSLIGEPQESEE